MSYQVRRRRCRKCRRKTTQWRELPDPADDWVTFLEELAWMVRKRLFVPWNCRVCKGVPLGPLGNSVRKNT
jgi:hypothetical protein